MSDTNNLQHGPVEATVSGRSRIDDLRDELMAELCGLGATLTAAMDAMPGFVPCGHAFGVVIDGIYAACACGSESELAGFVEDVRARNEHVSGHRGVAQGAAVMPAPATAEAALLLAALRGIAADAYAAMGLGRMDDELDVLLANALAALGSGEVSHDLLVRAGKAASRAYELAH